MGGNFAYISKFGTDSKSYMRKGCFLNEEIFVFLIDKTFDSFQISLIFFNSVVFPHNYLTKHGALSNYSSWTRPWVKTMGGLTFRKVTKYQNIFRCCARERRVHQLCIFSLTININLDQENVESQSNIYHCVCPLKKLHQRHGWRE